MSQHPFDQLSKQLFEELLKPFGEVEISKEVPGESHFIYLYFSPSPKSELDQSELGLLGKMVERPCLIEPFRNPPSLSELESCLLKLFWLLSQLKRRSTSLREEQTPRLWIISPTVSQRILDSMGAVAKSTWPEGVYETAGINRTGIIVIHQLPVNRETLWLRLLGKGKVQQQAIREVIELPKEDSMRKEALRLLSSWKIGLEKNPELRQREGELTMPLSQAFLEWEQKTQLEAREQGIQIGEQKGIQIGEQRGIQIGEQRGIKQVALNLLRTGMEIEQIVELTGLSPQQVQELQQQL